MPISIRCYLFLCNRSSVVMHAHGIACHVCADGDRWARGRDPLHMPNRRVPGDGCCGHRSLCVHVNTWKFVVPSAFMIGCYALLWTAKHSNVCAVTCSCFGWYSTSAAWYVRERAWRRTWYVTRAVPFITCCCSLQIFSEPSSFPVLALLSVVSVFTGE